MSGIYIVLIAAYAFAVLIAVLSRRMVNKMADSAIEKERLNTGVFRFCPAEGKRAVELAKAYKSVVNGAFWFLIALFPALFIIGYINGAI